MEHKQSRFKMLTSIQCPIYLQISALTFYIYSCKVKIKSIFSPCYLAGSSDLTSAVENFNRYILHYLLLISS